MTHKIIVLLAAIALPTCAFAQFSGPSAQTTITVAEAKKLADDTPVILEGKIQKHLGKDKYQFADASGTVTVDIDNSEWKGLKVSEADTVRLTGEVDKKLSGAVEIDIDTVSLVSASAAANAKKTDNAANAPISVAQAKALSDDTPVVLEGKIEKHLGKDYYVFSDATGSITVDIDKDEWKGLSVSPGDTVRLTGEVDKDASGDFKVDVKTVSLVK